MAKNKNWREFDFTPAKIKKVVDQDGNLIRREYIYSPDQVTHLIQFYESPQNREILHREFLNTPGEEPFLDVPVAGYMDTLLERMRALYMDEVLTFKYGQAVHIIGRPGEGKTTELKRIVSGFSKPRVISKNPKFDYIFVISFGERDYEVWGKNGFVNCLTEAHPDVDIRVAWLNDFYEETIDHALQIIHTAMDLVKNKRKDVLLVFDGLSRIVKFYSESSKDPSGIPGPGGLKFKAKQVMQLLLQSAKMLMPQKGETEATAPSLTTVGTLIVDPLNNNISAVLNSDAYGWSNNHIFLTQNTWEYTVVNDYTGEVEGFTSLDPSTSFNRQAPSRGRSIDIVNTYIQKYKRLVREEYNL